MKTHQLSHDEVVRIFHALEHAERAVCMVSTVISLLTDSNSFHGMGRSMQVGIYEAASELEERYSQLEQAVQKLHAHPKLKNEEQS